jgi:DNA-binding transcriptional LysR family regulator
MDWDNYRAFLEVYRSGDLGHAALALEMSVPTVRRRLDAVESQIGFPLFERTPRGLSPTPVARRLVHSIAAMGDSAAVAGTLKEGPARSITVSADDAIAFWVADANWAELRRSRPNLGITVLMRRPHTEVRDLRADVAVSHVRPRGAPARSAGALDVGLFAHRDYLSRVGAPDTVADLEPLGMVAAEADEARSRLEARLGLPADCGRPAFRTDSCAGRLAAIEAGVGIGACYLSVAEGRRDLVRVLPNVVASLDCWVWSLRPGARDGAAGLVFDHLTAALNQQTGSAVRAKDRHLLGSPLRSMAA